jgi:hypothetical protein
MAAAVSSTNLASDPLGKESANSAIRTSNRQLASTAPGEHRQSQSNVAAEQSAAITRLNSAITEKKPGTSTTSKVGKSTMQSHDALATKIITEDLAWNLAEVKPLKDFCIQSIVQNFSGVFYIIQL